MNRRIIAAVAALTLFGVRCGREGQGKDTAQTSPARPSLETLQDRIKPAGAKAVVTDLFHQKEAWRSVLDRVASGDSGWMSLAVELHRVADGGAREELNIAAAESLQYAPAAALDLLVTEFTIEMLCRNENSLGDTLEASFQIIKERREALIGVKVRKLEGKKQRCLVLLDELAMAVRENAHTWFSR